MSVSFPKPHKPNVEANRSSAGPELRTKRFNRYGELTNEYSAAVPPDVSKGIRSYGTGFPLIPIGPGKWFKRPSDYYIYGKSLWNVPGTCFLGWSDLYTQAFNIPEGTPSRILSGSHDHSLIDIPGWATPAFGGDNLADMPNNTRIRLGTELMLKVGGKKASFGEALAESHKTFHHLINTVKDLAGAVHAARKGRWKDVAKHLRVRPRDFTRGKTVSSRWLEFQYGWKPLMHDIYDTHQLLQNGFRQKAQIASNVRQIKDSFTIGDPNNGPDYSLICETQTLAIAKVFYKINDSQLANASQMGLINPASVLWEVTPFSFVVDWLIPVGNTIEALTASFGVDFIGGYYGFRAEAQQVYQDSESPEYPEKLIGKDTRSQNARKFGYRRTSMTGFPVPGFYYKSPFSSTHALSALALISQLTGKRH